MEAWPCREYRTQRSEIRDRNRVWSLLSISQRFQGPVSSLIYCVDPQTFWVPVPFRFQPPITFMGIRILGLGPAHFLTCIYINSISALSRVLTLKHSNSIDDEPRQRFIPNDLIPDDDHLDYFGEVGSAVLRRRVRTLHQGGHRWPGNDLWQGPVALTHHFFL
jgi:hypothetical protein